MDTIITEKSSNISGGEKQKLSLIRSLLKEPDVLILDESTSALDKKSVSNLIYVLNEIKSKKIIIFITHNQEILDIADEAITLTNI